MDFQSFKQSVVDGTKKLGGSIKTFGGKTLEFTGSQLSSTPLFIETNDEYEKFLSEKRLVVVAFDDTREDIAHEITLMIPVWSSFAFMDVATLRYMNATKSSAVIATQTYALPLEMRVFYEGKETVRLESLDAVKTWWKARPYQGNVAPQASESSVGKTASTGSAPEQTTSTEIKNDTKEVSATDETKERKSEKSKKEKKSDKVSEEKTETSEQADPLLSIKK